ncbi:ACP S-malonyltransferase [Pelagicoccus sp. SDUM812005]|uniref:ACP S-malonyltransferase n=1 Tax=Pelagicoccus sp. SDUM812005 TaxID=3041257 RepID=UPI00280E3BA6|nr:ACP S-malonyltransferase [Pelagicoccus sp. SDUM812005]MDQ8179023.1 ACP S-malonyltransferase [Pelagicoccus sp. SDUM812005]
MTTALMFSGQGAQKVGMGKDLYENSEIARALYDKADEILGWKITELSFEGPQEALTETKVCQVALFVHGYAVFEILKSQGKLDDVKVAMGLSLGEVTAYTAAGVFDFETGLKVVAERARLMQEACEATNGSMAAVIGVEREVVASFCEEMGVEMANLNCPGQIVISGEAAKIEAAVAAGKERGFRRVMPLDVAGAYHSRLMMPARDGFAAFLAGIEFKAPQYTVFTNTTGKEVSEPNDLREALVKQVVSSVLWEDCMVNAAAGGVDLFWELGVGGVLKGQVKRTNKDWANAAFETWADLQS